MDCLDGDTGCKGVLPFPCVPIQMLQNPTDFAVAVQALFATQKQAITAGMCSGVYTPGPRSMSASQEFQMPLYSEWRRAVGCLENGGLYSMPPFAIERTALIG